MPVPTRGEEPAPRSGPPLWTVALLVVAALAVGAVIAQAVRPRDASAPAAAPLTVSPPPRPAAPPPPPDGGPYSPEQARAAEEQLLSESAFTHPVDVPAPDVPVVRPDGKPLRLAALRGKVLFVNFWATWCPPCIQEMPSMLQLGRALAAAHPGKFQMVAVSGDDSWEAVHAYFKGAFGGPPKELVLARDPDASAAQAYYCAARGYCPNVMFPETYIVDRKGRVVAMLVGPRDWSDPGFRRWLEFLITG
jgi:thiol-disulfide isomerase/thioredoxin